MARKFGRKNVVFGKNFGRKNVNMFGDFKKKV